ncbi:MAG TPA: glycoside hydrolase family 3 N-terminal domain-containing protein [Phototrophicaceae bacterium]|nr:glycoside hydrolase family 3 N-terminal domain-containing protein [Phototrophicaceae bacterium]
MAFNRALMTDTSRSVEERVEYLLEQMTLDEKLAQLGSFWVYEILEGITFAPAKAQKLMGNGIGQITRLGGSSNVKPSQAAELANTIQKYLQEQTRLQIPAVIHEECCGGYMAYGATVFPQAIGVASMWEPELVEAMTNVIREQMRSVGTHHALAPVIDVTRDARWGRTEETFGEDPYLVAQNGMAYTRGLQGADLKDGIVATAKHFVGYGLSEGGMNWAPAHIPARELREVYLYPFEAAVKEAKLASLMNAYHELDGVPCGASRELLTDILRGEWGFDGTVVSDYFAVNMLAEYHQLTGDKGEAAGMALEAGIDVELPSTDCYGAPLREAVQKGLVREDLINTAVRRVLAQKIALGLFENPFVDAGIVVFDTPEQRQLAREIAQKSIVLLKNEGDLLPLKKDLRSIAVIGPNADQVRHLFGDYSYPAHIQTLLDTAKENPFGQATPNGVQDVQDFIQVISVVEAIKQAVSPQTQVYFARGCEVQTESRDGFAEAIAAAQQAEVVILVMGDKAGLADDCTSGEARDRAVLDLPGVQGELVRAIYEIGKPVVLVLLTGRPVALGWMTTDIPAILEAWFPGEEGSGAIADVLFGDVNPGGKLPMTFPVDVGQVPIYYGHKPSGGRSHWKGNYVEMSTKPQYPFGYGLSYTHFDYTNLRIEQAQAQAGEIVTIQVDICNGGSRVGDEVVQLYTHVPSASMTRPVKELKGFKRVTLQPGESRTVTFHLPVNLLGFYNREMAFVVEPGAVEVLIGSSSADIRLQGTLTIASNATPVEKVFTCAAQVE